MSAPAIRPDLSPAQRREGFLVGAAIGSALAAATAGATDLSAIRELLGPGGEPLPLPAPPGHRRAATALADALLEELLAGGVDLHRLSHRWVEWWASEGADADPLLAASLDHLREFDAPVELLPRAGCASLAAVLPAALASASPKAMIAGAFHVARILDPSEESGLAAVSVVVAAAALLEGRRDIVPEVLALLRANAAPASMLDGVTDVLRNPRVVPAVPRGDASPTAALAWLLWVVEHQPRSAEALTMMVLAGGIPSTVGATLGALLGARDGEEGWPAEWRSTTGEEATLRSTLARRLSAE